MTLQVGRTQDAVRCEDGAWRTETDARAWRARKVSKLWSRFPATMREDQNRVLGVAAIPHKLIIVKRLDGFTT